MAVESRREAKESRGIRMEKGKTGKIGKTKLSKPGGGFEVDGKLTDSTRSNSGHNRTGPQGGEANQYYQEMQYMNEAKMADNYRNIRKQVQTETTVGERGELDERESSR